MIALSRFSYKKSVSNLNQYFSFHVYWSISSFSTFPNILPKYLAPNNCLGRRWCLCIDGSWFAEPRRFIALNGMRVRLWAASFKICRSPRAYRISIRQATR